MKKAISILTLTVFVVTLLVYSSVLISPLTIRVSGFVSLLIPVVLLINIILSVYFLIKLSKKAFLPLLALVIGYKFIMLTFSISSNDEKGDFSVMSYNIKWLVETGKGGGREKALDWISNDDASIKCFQEFHSRGDVIRSVGREGAYQRVIGGRGNTLAIFSKFPIVNSGILLEKDNINNILYADIKVHQDTLRVYNVHLESMGIEVNGVSDTEQIKEEYNKVKTKFVSASIERTVQIEKLLDHIEQSSYPVIISGDFNDTPYSYNHFLIKKTFKSAFELAGHGFGFTFNGGIPFLRIDHQFFSNQIKVSDYTTFSDTYFSDHFPVKGEYSILK